MGKDALMTRWIMKRGVERRTAIRIRNIICAAAHVLFIVFLALGNPIIDELSEGTVSLVGNIGNESQIGADHRIETDDPGNTDQGEIKTWAKAVLLIMRTLLIIFVLINMFLLYQCRIYWIFALFFGVLDIFLALHLFIGWWDAFFMLFLPGVFLTVTGAWTTRGQIAGLKYDRQK